MKTLDAFFSEVNAMLDDALDKLVPASDVPPERLHSAVRWSLFAGGKRVRPAILIATGRMFGAGDDTLMRTAAAAEMIHTYSLIHDDLPAMDDDDLRRGRATCHKQFDEATAILAGDVLQTLAFKAIADDERLSADIRVRLIAFLADASGTPNGMVSGQQLDLDAEGQTLSLNQIEQVHRQKTGALITASAVSGAIIGGATDNELDAVRRYAENLGLLFQMTDDLIDVTQETATLGKTAGKDAAANKATYPAIIGVEETRQMANAVYDKACAALAATQKDPGVLRDIAFHILNRRR